MYVRSCEETQTFFEKGTELGGKIQNPTSISTLLVFTYLCRHALQMSRRFVDRTAMCSRCLAVLEYWSIRLAKLVCSRKDIQYSSSRLSCRSMQRQANALVCVFSGDDAT